MAGEPLLPMSVVSLPHTVHVKLFWTCTPVKIQRVLDCLLSHRHVTHFAAWVCLLERLDVYRCNRVPENGASQRIRDMYFEIVLSDMEMNH